MFGRLSFVVVLGAFAACASSVKGSEDGVDASPINFAIDAGTGPTIDSGPFGPDAMVTTFNATVTASCLFVRTGPDTANGKVACTDSGEWCNLDNDVCVPMGETVSVTGVGQAGAGCDDQWYPIEFRTYAGWSCGSFLEFPASAAAVISRDHETRFPTIAEGPQG